MSPSHTHSKGMTNVTAWVPADKLAAAKTNLAEQGRTISEAIRETVEREAKGTRHG